MDDVTDVVFRSIVADCAAPDMFFTEFVNVDGLCSPGRSKLLPKLAIDRTTDHHIVAQIWGKDPAHFETVAAELVDMGFDGVDINMGCPEKAVVKNGCCSALINDRDKAAEIIRAVQKGVAGRVPVSVKTRLGWNSIDLSWIEFLLEFELNMLSIHLRTRAEMSDVDAHWESMPGVVSLRDTVAPHTTLIGNGDVLSRAMGEALVAQTGCDGVMIGRGIFKDPFCFANSSPWSTVPAAERIALFKRHVERFITVYSADARSYQTLKRFCKVYINGFDHASELRERVMRCTSAPQILMALAD